MIATIIKGYNAVHAGATVSINTVFSGFLQSWNYLEGKCEIWTKSAYFRSDSFKRINKLNFV